MPGRQYLCGMQGVARGAALSRSTDPLRAKAQRRSAGDVNALEQKLLAAGRAIALAAPSGQELLFLHSGLAQLGLPRSPVKARRFERTDREVSLLVEAGELWDGARWLPQPLPYGTRPRLILLDICNQAVRSGERLISVERTPSRYLERLDLSNTGGQNGTLTALRTQLGALSVCTMRIGLTYCGHAVTLNHQLISGFSAWVSEHDKRRRRGLWPGEVLLNPDFHASLLEHAVPLDRRAICALAGSALALDIYSWWAQRLHRVPKSKSTKLTWAALKRQFGQEYTSAKYFKRAFAKQARKALAVYPEARVEQIHGGISMRRSRPPVRKAQVVALGS